MVERKRPSKPLGGDYFPTQGSISFIPSGCSLLDCVLGGGWPLGRVSNIVGDRSSGKTLCAIEACANFARTYDGPIFYREAEAAFDVEYAKGIGLPSSRVDFGPEGIDTIWDTVEDVFEDLDARLEKLSNLKKPKPALYIIDSLDGLSSRAELESNVGEGFRLEKQKILGELFRRLIRRVKASSVHVMFISQVRDKIGVVFGEKQTRTGGKALDFYASQIIWLAHLKTLVNTSGGVKRATGIRVLVKCKKNKIGLPFRTCEFPIRFGFGIDDAAAAVDWLKEHKLLQSLGLKSEGIEAFLDDCDTLEGDDYKQRCNDIRAAVLSSWAEVEDRFRPSKAKYR